MCNDKLIIRKIHFANSVIEIGCQGERAKKILTYILRDLPVTPIPQANRRAQCVYRLVSISESDSLSLYEDGELIKECRFTADMAIFLLGQICYRLAYFSGAGLLLHSALVSRAGVGVLLPGSTGKGKSTLAAWLLHCGYDYLTDELVFIPETGESSFQGFSRPLNMKAGFRTLQENQFGIPHTASGIIAGSTVDLIPPELFGKGKVLSQVRIGLVVFPNYLPNTDFKIQRLSKAQIVLELMQCLINARNLPEHGFPFVTKLARSVPGFRMSYSDLSTVESVLFSVTNNLTDQMVEG
jgi:hypothetical protein